MDFGNAQPGTPVEGRAVQQATGQASKVCPGSKKTSFFLEKRTKVRVPPITVSI